MWTDDGPLIRAKCRIRVCLVQHDALDQRAEACNGRTKAAFLHRGNHVRCQLQVPCVVEFTRFHDRTAGCSCITTTLEGHGLEGRLVRITIVLVCDHLDHVVGAEFRHNERTGADRTKVLVGTLRSFCAHAVGELCSLNVRAFTTNERTVWEWCWLGY